MPVPENNQIPEVQPSAPDPAPALRDKRVLPEGVVPKQAQGYVIAGLAVLILMAVMFSKNHAKPAPKDASNSPLAVSNEMNQKKIQELEQDLSADERQNAQARQMAANNAVPGTNAAPVQTVPLMMPPPQSASAPPADPVADAEKELAFKSRFVSNLVTDQTPHIPVPSDDDSPSDTASVAHAAAPPQSPAPAPPASDSAKKRALEVNVNNAHGQPYVVFEGTTIDTVLANRLDGEFAGPLKVMVTNPVYSHDGQHLLIPEGTFILGDVQKVGGLGQKRLAVTFHRLLMPDGYSVDLDQFHGLDQIGDTGLKDKVNNHYVEIFGASIALGIISGAAEATNANSGYNESGTEAYKSGVASSLSQSSANVLDRFINIPPTITIREGHRIKVYITQDMLLPAYKNHSVPSNF
jgi:type IV secretory pathway VirB10-like protein